MKESEYRLISNKCNLFAAQEILRGCVFIDKKDDKKYREVVKKLHELIDKCWKEVNELDIDTTESK